MVAQTVKNLPAMQETWVQSLGWEDPLDKGMAMHSSILAWKSLGVRLSKQDNLIPFCYFTSKQNTLGLFSAS